MKTFNFPHLASLLGTTLWLATAGSAHAQQAVSAPAAMSMEMNHATSESNPATQAYRAGSAAMMQGMDAPYTGDADRDFAAHMLPHHEGAVSMAKVELKYGTDPVMLKLARAVIKAQDEEIALMKDWQAKHGVK